MNHHDLVAKAEAEDAARAFVEIAERLERIAGKVDMLSEKKARRMAEDCRKLASLKRPRAVVRLAPIPSDVANIKEIQP